MQGQAGKNSADFDPDAILDPFYCRFGNDDCETNRLMLDISFSGAAFGFHTASGGMNEIPAAKSERRLSIG